MKYFIVLCALVAAVAGDVSHLPSNEYLPPTHHHYAASTPAVSYSAPSYHVEGVSAPVAQYETVSYSEPAPAYSAPAVSSSAPAVSYSAPAASYSTYETAASEPAHSYSSNDGYRYKTAKRRVIRRRRDVSGEYLPPVAASAPVAQYETVSYSEPAQAYSGPAVAYSAPAASYSTYETAASEPAHSYSSNDGYRYKTAKRRVIRRRRRDVSGEYLPPVAASTPVAQYESVSYSEPAQAYSGPAVSYAAPAASYSTYETAASEPAHTYSSNEGYRYKTAKRRVIRRRRDVSGEYLPPVAASAPVAQYESVSYSEPAQAYSGPAVAYSAPAASYSTYETAASEPAHTYSSNEGYRYKTAKRRVIRRRRDVSGEYLPPVAASAPVAQYESVSYSEPAPAYSSPAVSYSAPAVSYAAPAASYSTYETAASEPAHSYSSNDGYRYKTAKRRVIRRRRY